MVRTLGYLSAAVAALTLSSGSLVGEEVDWSVYGSLHVEHGEAGGMEASLLAQVRGLPVSVFWDSGRAVFRPALIGDVLSADRHLDRFRDYLSTKASLVRADGRLVSTNVTVVDSGRVYMETLVVVRILADMLGQLTDLTRDSRGARAARLAELRQIAERVGTSDWSSSACLASQLGGLEAAVERADVQLGAYSASLPERLQRLEGSAAQRRQSMAERNASLTNQLVRRASRQLELAWSLGAELLLLAEEAAVLELRFSELRIAAEQEMQVEAMRRSHESEVAAMRFRVVEEHRKQRENEVHEVRLLRLEHSFRLQAAHQVVASLFSAVRSLAGSLLERPFELLMSLATVVLVVVAVVVGLELMRATMLFLRSAIAGKGSRLTLRFKRVQVPDVSPITDEDVSRQLDAVRAVFQAKSSRPQLVVISGGSGVGKSTILAHLCNEQVESYRLTTLSRRIL